MNKLRLFEEPVHLFTLDLRLVGGLDHQVLENGGKRGDADPSAHQDGHFEVDPLLVALAKGPVQVELDRKWKKMK